MAALNGGAVVPAVRVENAPSPHIKDEAADANLSPYLEEDDVYEDAGDLNFSHAHQQLWLSRIPKSLWELWARMPQDDEIEIGIVRVEGDSNDPKRVSLKLNPLSEFQKQPKEYNLLPSRRERLQPKKPRNAFVFSEKDMPGYKRKSIGSRDEDGSSYHGRSYLYEKNKRDSKRKESKKRFEPYTRRPIPKQTAIAGAVSREFECAPVENEEYWELERLKAETMLKPKEDVQTSFDKLKGPRYLAPGTVDMYGKTNSAKQEQKRRDAAKENRASRLPKNELIDMLLDLFQYYKYWGLRELKKKTNQPDAYLREVLNEIATMWKSGDLNGKWELKPEFKERDAVANYAEGMAPDAADSEAELGEDDDDDENETFENV